MIRDEPVFLPIWAAHWRRVVPPEHMFILIDGLDQPIPEGVRDCQVIRLPRRPLTPGWDEARWRMLSAFAASLLDYYIVYG